MNNFDDKFISCLKCEVLGENTKVFTSKEHTFGTDAILLADFASPTPKTKAIDFGTGCGIIPLFWASRKKCRSIVGVDIQPQAVFQAGYAVEQNGLQDKISIIESDLKELDGKLPTGQADLVTMNPPYKQLGHGIISCSDADKIARHESACTLEEIAFSAARLLKFGGSLCICHRPERLCDIFAAFRAADCEPKRIRFVQQREGKAPWLVLCEGKKGRKSGLTCMPPLYIEKDGEYSKEYCEIYGEYR